MVFVDSLQFWKPRSVQSDAYSIRNVGPFCQTGTAAPKAASYKVEYTSQQQLPVDMYRMDVSTVHGHLT